MVLPTSGAGRNLPAGRITKRGALRLALDPTLPTQFASDPEAHAAFTILAELGLTIMQGFVPVLDGFLLRSLKARVSRARGTISVLLEAGGPDARHWAFVEYGTGERGRASKQPEPGLPRGYHHGAVAGMRAQPYMRPTMLQLRRKLL